MTAGTHTPGIILYDAKKHAAGVSCIARQLARAMGLPPHESEDIGQAGYYHDVGKEFLPAALLNKPGRLTAEEYARIQEHTRLGFIALDGLDFRRLAALAALEHHERMDGSGYMGRTGKDISLVGRIVAVADVYDSLSTARPYRPAWDAGRILRHIASERGRSLDTKAVDALMRCLETQERGM